MLSILAVNASAIIVGVVVAAVLVGGFGIYIASKIKAKKRGGSSCGCDCSSCDYCAHCHSTQKKDSKDKT